MLNNCNLRGNKMVVHLHVSIPHYMEQKISQTNPYNNKSEWVQELISLGLDQKEKEKIKEKNAVCEIWPHNLTDHINSINLTGGVF